MKNKIEQRLVDKGLGDCMTATLASLLEMPYEAVPNFNFMPAWVWHNIFIQYLWGAGWEYDGNGHHETWDVEKGEGSFDGFYMTTVPSRNYSAGERITHSVVMDANFKCVHDPHPNKNYQNENLKHTYLYFHGVKKRTDEGWLALERNKQ